MDIALFAGHVEAFQLLFVCVCVFLCVFLFIKLYSLYATLIAPQSLDLGIWGFGDWGIGGLGDWGIMMDDG